MMEEGAEFMSQNASLHENVGDLNMNASHVEEDKDDEQDDKFFNKAKHDSIIDFEDPKGNFSMMARSSTLKKPPKIVVAKEIEAINEQDIKDNQELKNELATNKKH